MAIDISTQITATGLHSGQDRRTLVKGEKYFSDSHVISTWSYQFRYTVHRQFVGFFTPMVFDVDFVIAHSPLSASGVKKNLEVIIEPFVEGALMVDQDSFVLVEMLKGQQFGFNRTEELQRIRKIIADGGLWYSDWETPPMTIQNHRIFSYDKEKQASLLDPLETLKLIQYQFEVTTTAPINRTILRDEAVFISAVITDGYCEKVTKHA